MNKLLYVSCIIVITFFYLLFSDGTSLDFIQKMIDNIVEVVVFISFMSIIGWFIFYIIKNIKFNNKDNSKNLNTQIESLYNDEPLDFCTECKDEDTKKNNNYCQTVKNLHELVEKTSEDISYKSIAITGEWGTGKSSVLCGLKNLLEKNYNNYVVIYINVWKYKETSQIISALENELNNKFPNDSFFIKSYFELIASWYEKECFLKNLLPTESQEEFEQRIIKQLINKRLVIMIDEIDRIVDKSELMEILKLIKVHSNIKKTTIITAISQKHFLQTMGQIDPKYLQKYFYYTFPVPSFSQQDFFEHNYQIFKTWESSNDYLETAYKTMRDEYFEKEIWKYLSNHREAKQLLIFLEKILKDTLNSHPIIQEKEIVKKYSIIFFYLALLHTTNLGLYLQIETIDEENDNEIIKIVLEHISINDFKLMYKEFKQRKINYGSHPWFLVSYYIDTNKYSSEFSDLYTKQNFHNREHYKLLLENITFEQLQIIKEYLPYLLNASIWVYQAIQRLDKNEDFKKLVVESFNFYKGNERLKKLGRFIADIENKDLENWQDISWNDFEESIVEDIKKNDFSRLTLDISKMSQHKKDELKELLKSYFESDVEKWQKIEEMTDRVLFAGDN